MTSDNLNPFTSDFLRSHKVTSDEPVRRQTLGDLLHRSAKRFPRKIAIICGETKLIQISTLSVIAWQPVFRREVSVRESASQFSRGTRMVLLR
jgi:hypothetical protein